MSLKTCSVSVLLIVTTMVGFFFQDLVTVDVEILQVKRFDTFMNCYRDDSRQYVSSIPQFSVGFPLKLYIFFTIFDLVNWNLWIILDLNIQDRFEVDFQVRIVKGACIFWCVQYSPEHARMKLTYFIYHQLTLRWQIKHFTMIYGAANNNFWH